MLPERIPYSACPLCGSAAFGAVATGDCSKHPLYQPIIPAVITWCRCKACNHVFTDGYLTPGTSAVIFGKTNPNQIVGHDLEGARSLSAAIVERVVQHVADGPWLDVGFGNGSLLFTAAEFGFVPVGLDLRAKNVETMIRLGVEAHLTDLAEFRSDRPMSVISMADVLEHMPFPKPALEAAHRLLTPRGVLFLSMPNIESFVWLALDEAGTNPYWGELEHYHNFGRTRLHALLRETGFSPVHYTISHRYRAGMEVIAIRN